MLEEGEFPQLPPSTGVDPQGPPVLKEGRPVPALAGNPSFGTVAKLTGVASSATLTRPRASDFRDGDFASVEEAKRMERRAHTGGSNGGADLQAVRRMKKAVANAHSQAQLKRPLTQTQEWLLVHWKVPAGVETARERFTRVKLGVPGPGMASAAEGGPSRPSMDVRTVPTKPGGAMHPLASGLQGLSLGAGPSGSAGAPSAPRGVSGGPLGSRVVTPAQEALPMPEGPRALPATAASTSAPVTSSAPTEPLALLTAAMAISPYNGVMLRMWKQGSPLQYERGLRLITEVNAHNEVIVMAYEGVRALAPQNRKEYLQFVAYACLAVLAKGMYEAVLALPEYPLAQTRTIKALAKGANVSMASVMKTWTESGVTPAEVEAWLPFAQAWAGDYMASEQVSEDDDVRMALRERAAPSARSPLLECLGTRIPRVNWKLALPPPSRRRAAKKKKGKGPSRLNSGDEDEWSDSDDDDAEFYGDEVVVMRRLVGHADT